MLNKEVVEARLKAAKTEEGREDIIRQIMREAMDRAFKEAQEHPIRGLSTRNGPTLYQCLMIDRERECGARK